MRRKEQARDEVARTGISSAHGHNRPAKEGSEAQHHRPGPNASDAQVQHES